MKNLILCGVFFVSASSWAGVLLPLQTLRSQGTTDHCWAYSTGHMLEARAQIREGLDFMFNVEQDVKYWVDFERLLAMYRTKQDVYFQFSYEGGWQIEYLETLFKYGKPLLHSRAGNAQVWYHSFEDYFRTLPFMPVPRKNPEAGIPNESLIKAKIMGNSMNEAMAIAYITDILNRRYGTPAAQTIWLGQAIPLHAVAAQTLGKEFSEINHTNHFVLIKPVTSSAQLGWTKLLSKRYWGYLYDARKVINLIKLSLDNQWPVTTDDARHATTIIGYDTKAGTDYFAVADSVPGRIVWYSAGELAGKLNLLTFNHKAISSALPERTDETIIRWDKGFDVDQMLNINTPPGLKVLR